MQVNAINSALYFEGSRKPNRKPENKTQTNPMADDRVDAGKKVSNSSMRNATKAMALAVMMIPIGNMATSCSDHIDIDIKDTHIVHNPKDTVYFPVYVKPDTVWMDKIIRDTVNNEIIIRDTIPYPVIIPGDSIFVNKKYNSEVFEIMKDMMKEVGIETSGEGPIITRMIAKDEWNNALQVWDLAGKKSSETTPVFDKTTYGWDDASEEIVIGKNATYGETGFSKSNNGGLFIEDRVSRIPDQKPATADGYRLYREALLTKGEGALYRTDITTDYVDKGRIEKGDQPQSVFFIEPLGPQPDNELMWRWSDIVVNLGEEPEDQGEQ